jgi:4-amino-4-deoxy-L-arabinose transferase-like glycosyltransferase
LKNDGLSKTYAESRIQVVFLLGLCFFLYFFNLNQWDLWNPDEPRYAQVAREMVERGDWIVMHFNERTYADKPPLFFWAVAFSSFLWQGFSSFAVRFPSALFATCTVLLTFLLGKRFYGNRAGFFSGLILATSLEFAYLSVRANIDATLTFFTTASLYCFILWYFHEERKRARLLIYGFYAAMALATLTKGPIGFILPLLVCLIYLSFQKDWKAMKEMRLVTGLMLFLGMVLAWYLPAVARGGPDYLRATLLQHSVERFSTGWGGHAKPFYYYFLRMPVDFLPWSIFLPAAILHGFSSRLKEKKPFYFFLTWYVVIFIFFSLSKGKRGLYLLPLYPGLALLVGKVWSDFVNSSLGSLKPQWMSWPCLGCAAAALVAGFAGPWIVWMKLPSYFYYSLPVSVVLVAGGLSGLLLYRRRTWGIIFLLISGLTAAGFFYAFRVAFPLANPYRSGRFLSQEITSRIQPGEKVGIYGESMNSYSFYTGIVPIRELKDGEDLFRFLESRERVFCIVTEKWFEAFQRTGKMPKFELIARRLVRGDMVLLVSNR